jgi:UMF1 family MFS transporter
MHNATAAAVATSAPVEKNNPRVTTGWAMYDWANSVYPLVITSTIFPIYYGSVAVNERGEDMINFMGFNLPGSSLYTYAISASFLIIAALSPILTAIADFSGRKKLFLRFFCFMGAASCAGLFFFTKETFGLSVLLLMSATIGWAGSIVFYNSYLPLIATEDQYDRLSAKGFSLGYVGSVILLVLSLVIVLKPNLVGIDPANKALPPRISFLFTGLWWAIFGQFALSRLPTDTGRPDHMPAAKGNFLLNGFHELSNVWQQIKQLPMLKRFLLAYFTYNMGVQTVMYVATVFGDKVLKLESQALIITILLLQVVAILGAYLFARLSEAIGNTRALSWSVIIWALICVAGYFVQAGWSFYALASVIGLTMGGIQSLSRSTYSKIIPENTPDTASYFSFFDVTEKLSIVIGTAVFGIISQVTGDMRNSILALIVFFVLGLIFLFRMRGQNLRPDAAAEPTELKPAAL